MPVFETESRIGRIISIDGSRDEVTVLYPRFKIKVRHEDVMKLRLRTGELFATRIKNPTWDYEGYNNDGQYPMLKIKGKVIGFSDIDTKTSDWWWNTFAYVNVNCVLNFPEEAVEAVPIILREQHKQILELKKDDSFVISISSKYPKTD
jgi:hypothetical protein